MASSLYKTNIIKKLVAVALSLGCLYFLSVLMMPVFTANTFATRSGGTLHIMDFVPAYEAGRIAISPDRFHIYDVNVQLSWMNRIIEPEHSDVPMLISYPPFFFLLMAPTAFLSMKTVFILWDVLWSTAFLFTFNCFLRRYAPQFSRLDRLIVCLAVLMSEPAILALNLGQTSWWVAVCAMLVYIAIESNSNFLPGAIALSLSTIKPQCALPLIAAAACIKRWHLLKLATIVQILLMTATVLDVGWQSIVAYPAYLSYMQTAPAAASGRAVETMCNLRGLLGLILPANVALSVSSLLFLTSIVYLLRIWRIFSLKSDLRWPMALTVCFLCTLSPHVHDHDCILLAVAAALILKTIDIRETARIADWKERYFCLLLLYYPFVSWLCLMLMMSNHVPVLAVVNLLLTGLGIWRAESLVRQDISKRTDPDQ